MDALELLTSDHEKVKDWIEEYEKETDPMIKKDLVDKMCTALTDHATLEEEIFYPAVREGVMEVKGLIDHSLEDHTNVKNLIAEVESMSEDHAQFDSKVKSLGDEVTRHVQEEEEQLFPMVRNSGLNIVELGERMMKRKGELEEVTW